MTAVRWAVALALSTVLGHALAQAERCSPDASSRSAAKMGCVTKEKAQRRGRYAPPVEMERRQAPPPSTSRPDPRLPPTAPPPSAPPAVIGCDPGGCWDSGGTRYNAVGSGMMRGDGKFCQPVGNTMQCN